MLRSNSGRWRFIAVPLGLLVTLGVGWYWQHAVRSAWSAKAEAANVETIARARAQLQAGQPDEAIRTIEGIPDSGPHAAEVLSIKGLAEASLDRPDHARGYLERSLALDPSQPMTLKVLAAVEFGDNDPDRGFRHLAAAANLDPSDFRPWYASGATMLRLGDRFPAAVAAFREALRRAPDHGPSRLGLAEALLGAGNVDEAGPLIDLFLRDYPDDPRGLRLAARRARLDGDEERARSFAEAALARDPSDIEARVLLAQVLLRVGRAREALDAGQQALTLAPAHPSALALVVQAAGALGERDVADAASTRLRVERERLERLERLRDEVRKRPEAVEPHWRLGQAAAEAGLMTLARRSFRLALEIDPTCAEARQGLDALSAPADD